jgi:hypothetical protein
MLVDGFQPKLVILSGACVAVLALAPPSTVHCSCNIAFCVLLGFGAASVSILPTSILIGPYFFQWRRLMIGVVNAGIGLGGFK